jgi:hypothetical protein
MFVQSRAETNHDHKNGVALQQRRGNSETLVQWQNGRQRWVNTADLKGTIVLIGNDTNSDDYEREL